MMNANGWDAQAGILRGLLGPQHRRVLGVGDLQRIVESHGYVPVVAQSGSGKTHLAIEMIEAWLASQPERRHLICTDRPEPYRAALGAHRGVLIARHRLAADAGHGLARFARGRSASLWLDGGPWSASVEDAMSETLRLPGATVVAMSTEARDFMGFPWGRSLLLGAQGPEQRTETERFFGRAFPIPSIGRLRGLRSGEFVLVTGSSCRSVRNDMGLPRAA